MAKQSRGKGEGSVRQRSNGTWEARISLGFVSADGVTRRVRKSVFGKTKAEALALLAKAQFEAGRGYPDADRLSLGAYLEMWLRDTVDRTVRFRTAHSYRYTVAKYIVPFIGAVKLSDLRPTTIDGFAAALRGRTPKPVPETSIRYACVVLKLAIRAAAVKEVIERNPFAEVRLHKPERAKALSTWSMEDAQRFFKVAAEREDRLLAFYVMAVATGLRHGELLALRWTDIDFGAKTVTVRHTLERRPGGVVNANMPVKSKAGERVIGLPESVAQELWRHRTARLAEGIRSEFVFVTRNATLYAQNNVNHAFHAARKAADVPKVRIHDLRHTCASLLRKAGKSLEDIKELLGHSDIAVTQIYAHIGVEARQDMANAMDEMFREKK